MWKYDVKLRRGGMRPTAQPPNHPTIEDWWRLWPAVTCPTLLVRGEVTNLLTRELAQKMVAANPHCTLVEIPGAGHSVPMDRPVEFEKAVREWLQV